MLDLRECVSGCVCVGMGVWVLPAYRHKYLKQPATHMDHKQHQQPNEPCRKHQIINKDYISVEQAERASSWKMGAASWQGGVALE